jgi:hypothetical protein
MPGELLSMPGEEVDELDPLCRNVAANGVATSSGIAIVIVIGVVVEVSVGANVEIGVDVVVDVSVYLPVGVRYHAKVDEEVDRSRPDLGFA